MNRLEKLRKLMDELQIDGMMINGDWNRRYISGFTGSNGVVLITDSDARLITDYRYFEQASIQTNMAVVLHAEHTGHKHKIYDEVAKQVKDMGIKRLGFEQQHLHFGNHSKLEGLVDAELIPTYDMVENLRMIKSPEEIENIRISSEITDNAFLHVLDIIRPGLTELEVARELETFIKKNGGNTSTFSPIVASGSRASLPHGRATDKVLEKGDMITIDFGTNYNGYWSDISRVVSLGEPNEQLKEVHQAVLRSFKNCTNHLKPGLTDQEVDNYMRDILIETGFNELSGTGTGHGIGLEVHEKPLFSIDSEKILLPNMVITIEPGVYLKGVGGARVEDMLLITEEGYEVLSPSTKELVVL
ncbi:Xaa-Pro peptidase family protein [Sporosarcina sp. ACRSL]|uniref:M24 family metallopeptidase n=1 Tax=Sporosarcina sp. ACRSL TaxID=2918215 RepID=UPI001EF5395C|nr:Xaa-Pro peptidase family protein [Sporosarcina sp. ACRSL]MCG7346146.1 Xaa-Pro peptidase family protein [Sporosarcina sp. ACRSL]